MDKNVLDQNYQKSAMAPFVTLVSVFFFWGFVAASNDILIPVFKEKLNLSQVQSQMISFAFYVAYTVGSIIYLGISRAIGEDVLNKIGYKNGIALGLVISALGTLLFYPAAQTASFGLMITGLFIVALGFSLQQTAANPLAIIMGNPAQGSQRLSLAGGVNNLGTTVGPLLVSFAIFGSLASGTKVDSIEAVKTPYLILGAAFLVVAVFFKMSSLPNKIDASSLGTGNQIKDMPRAAVRKSALHYPQLWMGMIAIFLYVGVEVSTASNLPEFMKQHLGTKTSELAPYVSLFWASLMVGRWTSSVGAFNISGGIKDMLKFLMPYIAFGVFLLVNRIAGNSLEPFYPYAGVIVVVIIADIMSKGNPARQLLIFSCLGIAALITGIIADGMVSVYAFISVGLFCSTLWPCIFTLAIAGLDRHTSEGSSFLIMMIMGGGVVSLIQGALADDSILGIQYSYVVGVLCFVYLAFYGWKVAQVLKSQGVQLESSGSAGH
jgi:MFS transporter, FHS family, L-fucose permease